MTICLLFGTYVWLKLKQQELKNPVKENKQVIHFEKQQQKIKAQVPLVAVKIKQNTQIKPKQEGNKNQGIKQKQQNIQQKPKLSQDQCSICYQKYYYSTETNCHHIFCYKCINQALLINERCPLCRAKIVTKHNKKQLHQEILKNMGKSEISKRQNQYLKFKAMLDSIVYIVIGNNSKEIQTKKSPFTKTKRKFNWQLYVKQTTKFKFQQVQFNINMGEPNIKGIRIKNAPFTFQSRGTFSFSCEIKIKPRNNQYSPITAIYRIQIEPGVHEKKIAIRKKIYEAKQ